jgi:hypothetical protein
MSGNMTLRNLHILKFANQVIQALMPDIIGFPPHIAVRPSWMEKDMTMIKKALVAFAATSMVVAPVAASAAPIADLRAVSATEDASEMEGSSWILILLGVAAAIGLIIVVSDDDEPTSP